MASTVKGFAMCDHLHVKGIGDKWHYPNDTLISLPDIYPNLAYFYTSFEERYRGDYALIWSRCNAYLAPLMAALYLFAIFFGQKFMENRKAFLLRGPLKVWNLGLAVFSLLGAIRVVPHCLYMCCTYGLESLFCSPPPFTYGHRATGFWIMLFVFSKYVELIDTAFIVLRKKPLTFLHWFHHVTVLLYSWDALIREQPCGIIFSAMNLCVHAIMYFYYFLTASGRRPSWGMTVTVLQILQMVVGVICTIIGLFYSFSYPHIFYMEAHQVFKPLSIGCYVSRTNLYGACVMYSAYLFLFLQFFVGRYFGIKKKPSTPTLTAEAVASKDAKPSSSGPASPSAVTTCGEESPASSITAGPNLTRRGNRKPKPSKI
eukprot:Selendium_serpulae@DN5553_c0_g1_i2.p1